MILYTLTMQIKYAANHTSVVPRVHMPNKLATFDIVMLVLAVYIVYAYVYMNISSRAT